MLVVLGKAYSLLPSERTAMQFPLYEFSKHETNSKFLFIFFGSKYIIWKMKRKEDNINANP